MKHVQNAYYHKTHFGGVSSTILELCPFTNGKIADFFLLRSQLQFASTKYYETIHIAYNHKTHIKFEFDGVTLTILELCPCTNGSIVSFL